MPFRVPKNLDMIETWANDPDEHSLTRYRGWLVHELRLCEEALASTRENKPRQPDSPPKDRKVPSDKDKP